MIFDIERRHSIRQWYRRSWMGNVHSHLHNRFIGKPHIIKVKWLKPGQYSDRVEVLFHAVFQVLVDFVEEELGHNGMMDSFDEKHYREKLAKNEYVHPFIVSYLYASWPTRRFARRYWAGLLGIATLDWYATLDGPDEEYPAPHQAQFGREAKELYLWYKYGRAKRPDPDAVYPEPPGPHHVLDDGTPTDDFFGATTGEFTRMNHFSEEWHEYAKKCNALEEQYHDEDQAMLKRVIDLRRGMWT